MKISTQMPQGFTPLIVVSILNFALFLIILISMGGENLPVRANDGRFLLWGTGGYAHHTTYKHYFEISRGTYLYIWIHGLLSIALMAFSLIKDFWPSSTKARRAS